MTETADPPRRRRRGCLAWGCLLPTVLVLAMGIAGFVAVRNYVRDHLDEWRADAPLVDLAVTVLRLRNASGSAPGLLEAIRGDQDPADLPGDIVLVPGAEPVVSITADVVVVFQETDLPPSEAGRRLRQALVGSGWQPGEEDEVPGGRETVWTGSERACTYQVVEGLVAATEVWIRCVPAAPDA